MERNELRACGLKFVSHDHSYVRERRFDPKAPIELELCHCTGSGPMRGQIVISIKDCWPDDTEPNRLDGLVGPWPEKDA